MRTFIILALTIVTLNSYGIEKQILQVNENGDTTKYSHKEFYDQNFSEYEEKIRELQISSLKQMEDKMKSQEQILKAQKAVIRGTILSLFSFMVFGLLVLFIILYAITRKKWKKLKEMIEIDRLAEQSKFAK